MTAMQAKKKLRPVDVGVGVALILTSSSRVLLGYRQRESELDCWQLPGGWLRLQESPQQAISRLTSEVNDLSYSRPHYVAISNNIFSADRHSVSLYFQARIQQLDVEFPDDWLNCQNWQWFDWNHLPDSLFFPMKRLRQSSYTPFGPNQDKTHVAF